MVQNETVKQYKSSLWHAVRFACVTASTANSATYSSHSSVSTIVMSMVGASKLKDTAAMERGRKLEPKMLKEVGRKLGSIMPSGIILTPNHSFMSASPDGITADGHAIVEIKCPVSKKKVFRDM